jgi:hypothetical protein
MTTPAVCGPGGAGSLSAPKGGGTVASIAWLALLAKTNVDVNLRLPGIIALVAGVLILIFPKLLNYLVAGYLIVVGLVSVFNLRI